MNWPFWSLSRPASDESCESIEPLLSLYADGMASAEEAKRVEAHLPDCDNCREALSWMQATQHALAARPVVAPPANLHSRIALAIAASSAAPITLRPARTFALRPAYAAAASLTVLGLVLSYSLWHAPAEVAVKPMPKQTHIASAPIAKTTLKNHALHTMKVKPNRALVDSNTPTILEANPVRHLPAVKPADPIHTPAPQEHVASSIPTVIGPIAHLTPHTVKAPIHAETHHLTASNKIAPTEPRHLPVTPEKTIAPKLSELPKIASRTPAPDSVAVHILPPTVSVQPVQTASSNTAPPSSKLGDILGPVITHIGQMHSVAYVTPRQSYQGATSVLHVMHTLDTEHFAYIDGVHTR